MTRPTKQDIDSGIQGWDGKMDDNFDVTFNGPFPVHEHAGDETDLEATFPAAIHDRCLVWVNHTTLGWSLYKSDTSWVLLLSSAIPMAVVSKSANYTATDTDEMILVDASSGAVTITLPTAVGRKGKVLRVKKIDSSPNNVTAAGDGVETLDGANTQVIVLQYDSVPVVSDDTEWWVI